MKRLIFIVIVFLGSVLNIVAQTPREVKQIDKERKNLWESPEAMLIAAAVILGIFIARRMSSRSIRKRDEEASKDQEEK